MSTGVIFLLIFIIVWVGGFLLYINKDKFRKVEQYSKPKEVKGNNLNKFTSSSNEPKEYNVNIVYKNEHIDISHFCDLVIKETNLLNPPLPIKTQQGKEEIISKEMRLSEINLNQYIKINQIIPN